MSLIFLIWTTLGTFSRLAETYVDVTGNRLANKEPTPKGVLKRFKRNGVDSDGNPFSQQTLPPELPDHGQHLGSELGDVGQNNNMNINNNMGFYGPMASVQPMAPGYVFHHSPMAQAPPPPSAAAASHHPVQPFPHSALDAEFDEHIFYDLIDKRVDSDGNPFSQQTLPPELPDHGQHLGPELGDVGQNHNMNINNNMGFSPMASVPPMAPGYVFHYSPMAQPPPPPSAAAAGHHPVQPFPLSALDAEFDEHIFYDLIDKLPPEGQNGMTGSRDSGFSGGA